MKAEIKLVSSKSFSLEVDFTLVQNNTVGNISQLEIIYSQLTNCASNISSAVTALSCRNVTDIGRIKLNRSTYVFENLFPGTFYGFQILQINKTYPQKNVTFKTEDFSKFDSNILLHFIYHTFIFLSNRSISNQH